MILYLLCLFALLLTSKITFTDISSTIPAGSYQNSCSECSLFTLEETLSVRLDCKCRIKKSSYEADPTLDLMHFTTIDPEACKGADIANNDGRLECSSNFFHAILKDIPPKILCKLFEERPIIAGLILLFYGALISVVSYATALVIVALPLIVFGKIYHYLKVIAILTALPYRTVTAPAAPAA